MTLTYMLALGYPVVFVASILLILDYMRGRDEAERKERDRLLERIQAPERITPENVETEVVEAANPEDDRDFWLAKGYDPGDRSWQ